MYMFKTHYVNFVTQGIWYVVGRGYTPCSIMSFDVFIACFFLIEDFRGCYVCPDFVTASVDQVMLKMCMNDCLQMRV